MAGRFKTIMKFTGLLLVLSSFAVNAQLLQDTTSLSLVRKNIDYIYNLQFDNAREVYAKVIHSYPGHPIVFLLKGMMTYWENYPLLPTAPSHISFEEDLRQCIKISESNKNSAYEAEYLLANLCARGLLLTFYADNGLIMSVIPLTMSTYKYIRRSFEFNTVCTDLNYFTGVYNYYRETYPKIYPVYKSLAALFPSGDAQKGLNQLEIAAISSVALRAESCFLLSYIYLNFENMYPEGLFYCRTLHEKYPENLLYLASYIKNLLLLKQYDEAEKLISAAPESAGNKFYQIQLTIFKGILQEKKYHDNVQAQQYYEKGINDISLYGDNGDEFTSFAYFGLSRISDTNGEKHASKIYRKQALQLADFKKNNFDK